MWFAIPKRCPPTRKPSRYLPQTPSSLRVTTISKSLQTQSVRRKQLPKWSSSNGKYLLGTTLRPPYSFAWTNAPLGKFYNTRSAKATDDKGTQWLFLAPNQRSMWFAIPNVAPTVKKHHGSCSKRPVHVGWQHQITANAKAIPTGNNYQSGVLSTKNILLGTDTTKLLTAMPGTKTLRWKLPLWLAKGKRMIKGTVNCFCPNSRINVVAMTKRLVSKPVASRVLLQANAQSSLSVDNIITSLHNAKRINRRNNYQSRSSSNETLVGTRQYDSYSYCLDKCSAWKLYTHCQGHIW